MSQAKVQTPSPVEQANAVLHSLDFDRSFLASLKAGVSTNVLPTEQLRVSVTLIRESEDSTTWTVTVTISPLNDAPRSVSSSLIGNWLSLETGLEAPAQSMLTPVEGREYAATAQLEISASDVDDDSKLTIH
jgi:hypothetical protein